MSCTMNPAQSCADCLSLNGQCCTAGMQNSMLGCCCDGTAHHADAAAVAAFQAENLRQDALYNMQLAQLQQQIDQARTELQRQRIEEIGRKVHEEVVNTSNLQRYHAGTTEVIDVEPISCESLGRDWDG